MVSRLLREQEHCEFNSRQLDYRGKMMNLQERVNKSLSNSQENGFEPERQTAEWLALDLSMHDADLEDVQIRELADAAQVWLDQSGRVKPVAMSNEDRAEIFEQANPGRYFTAGSIDYLERKIFFWRGNDKLVIVPFDYFNASGDGTKPDFHDVAIIDCGQTVRLGKYEATVEGILDEYGGKQ